MERADSALGPLIKDLGLEDALRLYRIKKSWTEAVGEPLSLHTAPAVLKGEVLHVNADAPAWLQEAGYFRAKLIERLARFGVAEIKMRLGMVEQGKPRRKTSEDGPGAEADPSEIEDILSSIEDGELKEAVRRAASKALGRRPRRPE